MTKVALIEKYVVLITKFVEGTISAPQFESSYLDMYKAETEELPENIYNVLNSLFLDTDAYCADDELRDEGDLDDEQLLFSANNALEELSD